MSVTVPTILLTTDAVIIIFTIATIIIIIVLVIIWRTIHYNKITDQNSQEKFDNLTRSLETWRSEVAQLIRNETNTNNVTLRHEFDALLHRLYEHQSLYQQRDDATIQRQLQFHQEMGNHIEKIRLLVEDQLHNNLEKKLNASFSNVADRLAKVHESLGEVNNLSRNMQDMHKLFSNVKTRGIFGEVQLENLLSQMLAPNQYQKNFKPAPYGSEIVEFAVRLPGQHSEVWLPVDAKFPNESMLRIQDSSERGNTDDLLAAQKMLEQQIKTFARDIAKKYINPPRTTDFAIMFLASESLFAETLRLPGLMEKIQMEYRITIAGPTTFCALLCSLQMGFRSLQIQERTADVWKILQEVRLEFNKFASTVEAVQKKLAQAHDQMDDVGRRSRVLEKRLTILEELEEQQ